MSELVEHASVMAKFLGMISTKFELSRLEKATLQISSSSYSILFSIRELINQGYFPSAEILMRCLLDRITTIAWIRENGESGVAVWERGWKKGERPETFKVKLQCLKDYKFFLDDSRSFSDVISEDHLFDFHGAIHGDTWSVNSNSVDLDGEFKLIAGPDTFNADKCKKFCKMTNFLNAQLIKEIEFTIPRLTTEAASQ